MAYNSSYSYGSRGSSQRSAGFGQKSGGYGNSYAAAKPVLPDITDSQLMLVVLGADISRDLYSKTAESIAKTLSEGGGSKKNASTQIRRFYDELVLWNDRVRLADDRKAEFEICAPYISMLVAKAAYAKGRDLVTPGFEKLMKKLVEQIKDAETLKQGKLFLEAVIGFRKGFETK